MCQRLREGPGSRHLPAPRGAGGCCHPPRGLRAPREGSAPSMGAGSCICGVKPVPIRVALGRLQQQQGWWKRGYRKGPPKHRCRGGAASPQHIRVAAHCEEVCDARSGAEAHIWARSRLLEAAAPEPADEAPDKGCPAAAAACIGSGAGETCPGCAGSGSLAWGRWWRWGCWCACSCVRVSGGRWERGPRRCRARLSSLRAAGSGELRLVDGGDRCAGRVEVKHDGEWGSVCIFEYDWNAHWATVVCRQLGCGRVARSFSYALFGQGNGRIWLQPFFCNGTESSLVECRHFGWGWHICGHEWDAGVTCTDAVELRLVGGGSPCAGRVEMNLQGQWGSVADPNWDMEDAEVVCQHLGCGSAAGAFYARERYSVGDGPVSVVLVDCKGNEATLWECDIRGWGPYKGNVHGYDTAVVCQGFSRLVGGDRECAGQLEVRQGRAWVGVCEDQVDMKAAQVVCRELGCGEALAMGGSGRFGAASDWLWDGGFQCNGSEPLLSACARRPAQSQGCSGRASIICSPYTGFRLENSSSRCSGRVEVAVRGTWGSVCAAEWDLPDAHVLCRHLGCGRALAVLPGGSFGSGEGPLRPDTFGCTGSERHPGECPVAVLGKPPCAPGNAAAVNCSGFDFIPSLRLVDGQSLCDGRLEETITSPAWRRVPLEQWEKWDVHMVCGVLGCGTPKEVYTASGTAAVLSSSSSEADIMTEEMDISGAGSVLISSTEEMDDKLAEVEDVSGMGPAPNSSLEEMVVVCSSSRRVRLVGSSGRCAGRVEVYSGGSWSSVCQEGWDLQDAAVVCRELGCGTALEAPSSALFGPGTGPLWPYMAECSGTEESLWECGRSEGRECGLGLGAGAVCSEQISVRLAGGRGRCRGYLEVSYNGTWGRVCSNGTSTGTAAAVCRQLGCGERGWLSAVPAQQPSRAWLAWVGCEDGARSLSGCPSAPWHLQSCGNGEHAHVECEEDTAGTTETNTNLYLEGATSTGVPSRITPAVAVGTVSVPTVLCVVLGTLLCLALGVLAVLLCRARVWHRGGSCSGMPGVEGAVAGLSAQALQRAGGMPELLAELQDAVGCQLVVTQVQAGEMESLQQAAAAQRVGTRETGQEGFGLCSLGELLQGQLRDAARCRSARQSCAMGQGSSSRRRTARERHVMAHILVAAHCEEVCDARSGAEAHIWARSRLLEAAAPEPADEAPDKGCPAAAAACIGSGAGETCPGCAGSGSLAWGRWWRWGCWCACSCVRVSGGRWERGPRRCRARLSSLRAAGSGELRLVDGGDRCDGRVEVKHGGEWGSVCVFEYLLESLWATVVCRQLGCGRVARASPYTRYGQGTGRIWLQLGTCNGTEKGLEDCPHAEWGWHFCGHERDVGVTCTDAVELRLVDGGSPCAGRVEVKLQGQWGSVVDDPWDMDDAEVVCQHLGCGSAAGAFYASERFSVADSPISVVKVDCKGYEATLWECDIRGWGPYKGNIHNYDTAVVCQGFSRLVGGDRECAGQLEVRQGRAWVGVCEDQVDMKVAQVVCRELGCGEVLAMGGSGRFGAASDWLWDGGFQCNGNEPLLSACARRPAQSQGCSGRASIICSPYTGFRLENSSSRCSGRVEVAVRGTWGSVCAAEWDLPDAHVLCRHLGCGRALAVLPGGSFGSGEGPLRPDTFGCTGSERHPGECPVAVLGKPPCARGNAAAVNCSGFDFIPSLRLVDGQSLCDGRLEETITSPA
ncbi:antigen WC1.1-like, partial [Acridotheres tristis]